MAGREGTQIDRHNWFNFCANFHGYIAKAGNLVEISSKYRSCPSIFIFFFSPFFLFFIVSMNSPFGFSVCLFFFIVIVLGLFHWRSICESRVHYGIIGPIFERNSTDEVTMVADRNLKY